MAYRTRPAEGGDATGQSSLAYCYLEGTGVNQDEKEAATRLRKAAAQNNAWSQERLGWCYEEGRGVDVDLKEAVKWYEKAAKQENEEAKEALKPASALVSLERPSARLPLTLTLAPLARGEGTNPNSPPAS